MKCIPIYWVTALLLSLWTISPATALNSGAGSYFFKDAETDIEIKIWYAKPIIYSPETPIVMVLHGVNRNARQFRDVWLPYAEKYGFMILAPEFSDKIFPGDAYALGNYQMQFIPDKSEAIINPRNQWSFLMPDRIFTDFSAKREKTVQKTYYLYGHSAGAQFIHRKIECLGGAKVRMAIIANAGWYTLPDPEKSWPYGLKSTTVSVAEIIRFLSFPLVILLGEEDTDPLHPTLRRTTRADEQGITRLERGKHFFEFGSAMARSLNVPFRWKLQTVSNVAHSNSAMTGPAAVLFAEDVERVKNDVFIPDDRHPAREIN